MMAAAAAELTEPLLRRLQNLSPLFNWVGPSLGRGISLNAIWTLPSSLLHGVGAADAQNAKECARVETH